MGVGESGKPYVALAERSCRRAVLSGTAVERRTHPYTIKPGLGVPLFACAVGGGTCPDPMAGHPLHPPRGMPRGAHLVGQVTQSVPPAKRALIIRFGMVP